MIGDLLNPHRPDGSKQFYSELSLNALPLSELMGSEGLFAAVPRDWHVVLTDVKESTQALNNGMHHLVNLVATGSIIAALNIARRAETRVPFFFGGDGATLIVPDCLVAPILNALKQHQENTQRNFGLELRVGSVPVRDIYANGQMLMIAKAKMSEAYTIPIVLGQGLQYAEQVIKEEGFMMSAQEPEQTTLNLEGMECRWDSIKPPEDAQEVLCLLVTIRNSAKDAAENTRCQAAIYSEVLKLMDRIFGLPETRSPIAVQRLRLKATFSRINREMRARLGRFDVGYLIENWLRTLIGFIYFRFVKEGQAYLRGIAQLSDTLVIDGRINTVIAGTAKQRRQFVESLDRMESAGDIYYGLYACAESVMSCYVRNRRDEHIHFIDGIGGGYTMAATVLKNKLDRARTDVIAQ